MSTKDLNFNFLNKYNDELSGTSYVILNNSFAKIYKCQFQRLPSEPLTNIAALNNSNAICFNNKKNNSSYFSFLYGNSIVTNKDNTDYKSETNTGKNSFYNFPDLSLAKSKTGDQVLGNTQYKSIVSQYVQWSTYVINNGWQYMYANQVKGTNHSNNICFDTDRYQIYIRTDQDAQNFNKTLEKVPKNLNGKTLYVYFMKERIKGK